MPKGEKPPEGDRHSDEQGNRQVDRRQEVGDTLESRVHPAGSVAGSEKEVQCKEPEIRQADEEAEEILRLSHQPQPADDLPSEGSVAEIEQRRVHESSSTPVARRKMVSRLASAPRSGSAARIWSNVPSRIFFPCPTMSTVLQISSMR